ncbi:MAG: cbb3-type cytochrome oxidase assembly protein CcoS [Thermodesulfobacteriota bacterium]|jgi:cbb3-type cytochrome oxidase maturation protein
MYLPIWMMLVVFSLWFSLMAFFWGLQSGQFSDQERARFLPLRDDQLQPTVEDPARLAVEVYVLISIGLVVLLGLAASLFFGLNG